MQNESGFEKRTAGASTLTQTRPIGVVLPDPLLTEDYHAESLPTVVFRSQRMGEGDAELGEKLTAQFVAALLKHPEPPVAMLFYNSAVLLCLEGSALSEALRKLEVRGSELLVCKTSADKLAPDRQLAVGRACTMDELLSAMNNAQQLIWP